MNPAVLVFILLFMLSFSSSLFAISFFVSFLFSTIDVHFDKCANDDETGGDGKRKEALSTQDPGVKIEAKQFIKSIFGQDRISPHGSS